MYGPQPYSCSDWEQPGVLSDYYDPPHERSNTSWYSVRRNAYRPPGELSDYYEPPHARSNSSWYSARQNVYRPPRNAFTSGDQFAEQERPLRQPHCARQSPNLGWSSPESHQQPFLHAKNQTCWDLPSQTSVPRSEAARGPNEHEPRGAGPDTFHRLPQADGDTGFGGATATVKLCKLFVERGAAGTVLVARTDVVAATLIQTNVDTRDHQFILGVTNPALRGKALVTGPTLCFEGPLAKLDVKAPY
ncbi:hypothetical protein SASPL_124402 [Salvia splendens]|uniref:Uncharacterized protein n=1 Tax=Salvia splendens TaxID=180675 RepID=A0A8X8XMT3_SALSN|nr:hypothetical protein SASPL_124402 [Salvia splendens]